MLYSVLLYEKFYLLPSEFNHEIITKRVILFPYLQLWFK